MSLDVSPQSRPIESSEVDEGWFDAEEPAHAQSNASAASADASTSVVTPDANAAPNQPVEPQLPATSIADSKATGGVEVPPTVVASEDESAGPVAGSAASGDLPGSPPAEAKPGKEPPTVVTSDEAKPDEAKPGKEPPTVVTSDEAKPDEAKPGKEPPTVVTSDEAKPDEAKPDELDGSTASLAEAPKSVANGTTEQQAAPAPIAAGVGHSAAAQSLSPVIVRRDGAVDVDSVPPAGKDVRDHAGAGRSKPGSKALHSKKPPQTPTDVANDTHEQIGASVATADARPEEPSTGAAASHQQDQKPPSHRARRVGYVGLAVGAMAAAMVLLVARPKTPTVVSEPRISSATPAVAAPELAMDPARASDSPPSESPPESASSEVPPVATVADSADAPAADPSAAAPAGSADPKAPSSDAFADAFKRNAAKKNAKWADLKDSAAKPPTNASAASKGAAAKPATAKPAKPGNADPLEVLKRLEEARKGKK